MSTNNEPKVAAGHDNGAFTGSDDEEPERDIKIELKGPEEDLLAIKMKPSGSISPTESTVSLEYEDVRGTANMNLNGFKEKNRNDNFAICWENFNYVYTSNWYELKSQRKPILSNLNGSFKSGELSAVLGPSGAGKSTLIDCLLGKRERGLSGQTKVVFDDPNVEHDRRTRRPLKIALIPQQDHLMDTLTVTETFMFASKIKNAHKTCDDEDPNEPFDHFANVQRVIKQLNLASCSNLRCGSLSGGQYKRVSIGQELLSRPDLLILDEPTSGLDSVTCFQTINALRHLIDTTAYPMAIVATIHQPDIEVFELFHKAYVLSSSGRPIFEGPIPSIIENVKFGLEKVDLHRKKLSALNELAFSSVDSETNLKSLREKIKMNDSNKFRLNPARLIVELAANEYGNEITNAMHEIQQYSYHQGGSSNHTTPTLLDSVPLLKSVMTDTMLPSTSASFETPAKPSAPTFNYNSCQPTSKKANQDKLLNVVRANIKQNRGARVYVKHAAIHCHRSWITIIRDPMLFSLQIFLHVAIPLLISYSFQGYRGDACPKVGPLDVLDEAYRLDGNVLDDLRRELRVVFENIGYMFFQIYVIIFAAVCVTSLTYPLIMHVLLKEYRNGWYSMSSYFLGRTIADLPVPMLNGFLAIAISYHLTNQAPSPYEWRFLSVAVLTILATLVAQTQGLMFGALLMHMPSSAVFVAPASTAPLVVVSGFLLRIQSLPTPLAFLSQFSYFTYLLNGFIVARYGFNRCPCNEEDFAIDTTHTVPTQASAIMNIWVDTFKEDYNATEGPDLVNKLINTITLGKTFGYNLTSCDEVQPYAMLDFQLENSDLKVCFIVLAAMLVAFRYFTYLTLSWKIGSSL